jgi:broad specificity phosphatase PhoE
MAGISTPAEIEPDLPEWNHGYCEGKLSGDIRGDRPD